VGDHTHTDGTKHAHRHGQVFRLEDYRPSDYLIPRTSLAFRLDANATLVTAELTIARREGAPAGSPLVLQGDGLVLRSIEIDGAPLETSAYDATSDGLMIARPPAAQNFQLRIVTEIAPAANTALMGLYRTNGVYCTQCEAEGFRRITYFLDRPDILSVYTGAASKRPEPCRCLLSNGNRIRRPA
jgi:aminopeptidase N